MLRMQFHLLDHHSNIGNKLLMCPQYIYIKDRKFYNRNLSSGKHPTKPLSIPVLEYSVPAVLINTHAISPEQ